MRVLVVGCTPLAAKTLAVVEELPSCELVGVVNLDPEAGRLKSNYDSFADWAAKNPERMHWTRDINGEATRAWIASRACDLMIQAGWSQIFKKEVLALPKLFAMGIHPAPLPKGRGGAIINWRLIEGGGPWGNSLFVMLPSVDAGDVLDTEPFELEPRDDIRTGHLKVDRTAVKMLRRTLPRIASGAFERRPQDLSQMTKYPRRKPEEGRIDPSWPARKWLDYVRALTHPFPGAFLETAQGPLVVWKAEAAEGRGAPGAVLEVAPGKGVKVGTGDAPVWLTLVTPPLDVECWCDEWARETGLRPGEVLAK